MSKCCINSNKKMQHKNSIKTYFSLRWMLAPLQINCIWFNLLLNKMSQNNGKERSGFGWVFEYFQWEKWPHKNTKINNQGYLQPPKRSETSWNKPKTCCLPVMNEWKRKRKGIHERNGFYTKLWGSTYPSSWCFLKLCKLWALHQFLSVVCARIHL